MLLFWSSTSGDPSWLISHLNMQLERPKVLPPVVWSLVEALLKGTLSGGLLRGEMNSNALGFIPVSYTPSDLFDSYPSWLSPRGVIWIKLHLPAGGSC